MLSIPSFASLRFVYVRFTRARLLSSPPQVLFDSADAAKAAIVRQGPDGRYRRTHDHIKQALMTDGRRVYERGGGYAERSGNTFPPKYIQVSHEEQLARLQEQKSSYETELIALEAQLRPMEGAYNQCRVEVGRLKVRGTNVGLAPSPTLLACSLCCSPSLFLCPTLSVSQSERDNLRRVVDNAHREMARAQKMDIPMEEDDVSPITLCAVVISLLFRFSFFPFYLLVSVVKGLSCQG